MGARQLILFLRIHTGIKQLDIHIRCNPSPCSHSSDLIKTPMNMLLKAPQCYHAQSPESRCHCRLRDYAKYMYIHLFMSLLSLGASTPAFRPAEVCSRTAAPCMHLQPHDAHNFNPTYSSIFQLYQLLHRTYLKVR